MTTLLLATLSYATTLDVLVVPAIGRAVSATLPIPWPGMPQTFEAPCGAAPNCRISVSADQRGEGWIVTLAVAEIRRTLLGREREKVITNARLKLDDERPAELFVGSEASRAGTPSVTYRSGLHVSVSVGQ